MVKSDAQKYGEAMSCSQCSPFERGESADRYECRRRATWRATCTWQSLLCIPSVRRNLESLPARSHWLRSWQKKSTLEKKWKSTLQPQKYGEAMSFSQCSPFEWGESADRYECRRRATWRATCTWQSLLCIPSVRRNLESLPARSHWLRSWKKKSTLQKKWKSTLHPRTIFHRAAAPAVRVAVKTEVSYKNDTIITIFFSPYKTKDTAKVALDSFNS